MRMHIGVWNPVGLRALVCFGVVLAMATSVKAEETFPVTAVVGFDTGIRKLATITAALDSVSIEWGDTQSGRPGITVDCSGLLKLTCDIYGTHRYDRVGKYTITINYATPGPFSSPASVTTTATVVPPGDFIVLSIGDSVASGEGNPMVERSRVFDGRENPDLGVLLGLWNDPESNYGLSGPCHQTAFSGPGMAVGFLEAINPGLDITFIHVACSGAKLNSGPVENIVLQLRNAREKLEDGRLQAGGLPGGDPIDVDVLLISGGGNNINGGFGSIVEACLEDDCTTLDLSDDFALLPGEYQDLADEINSPKGGTRGTVSTVYITEYYDPTKDQNGNFSTFLGCPLGGLRDEEWEFLYFQVVEPLNDAVAAAAAAHGWHLVGGIEAAFSTHGYCAPAADRWVLSLGDAIDVQGDHLGTAHPNRLGQQAYGTRIRNQITLFNPPVTTASAIAGGHPYAFGTWTQHDVVVSLVAQNPISQSGVGKTYFAVDDPACTPQSPASCAVYTVPFVINTSGEHVVTFFSENQFGSPERLRRALVRIDRDPPRMTCVPTPDVLWAPNGKMLPVAIAVTAVDDVSGPRPFVLASFGASEGSAADDMHGFVTGGPDTDGLLKAARFGFNPGRQYTLTYQSTDAVGNVGTCNAVVTVPHDQRKDSR